MEEGGGFEGGQVSGDEGECRVEGLEGVAGLGGRGWGVGKRGGGRVEEGQRVGWEVDTRAGRLGGVRGALAADWRLWGGIHRSRFPYL